jgi:hypothetical protein
MATLPRWPFTLDRAKAVESVLFVANRHKGPTLHSVSKILFHADKLHLSRYGRPISGDWYVRMPDGPVPSATYDILKTIRGDAKIPVQLPKRADALRVRGQYSIVVLRDADKSVLSPSELECLAESVEEHGGKTFSQRVDDSHGPAWQASKPNDLIPIENLLLEIENRDELRDYLTQFDVG